jgi:transposase
MPLLLEDAGQNLTPRMRSLLAHLWQEWKQLDADVERVSAEIDTIAEQDAACQRLRHIPGIGPLVSTATVAPSATVLPSARGASLPPGLD